MGQFQPLRTLSFAVSALPLQPFHSRPGTPLGIGLLMPTAEARQPLVSSVQADSCFRCRGIERYAHLEVPANKAFPTDGCQSGQWVATNGL
jgi:hypothetical protein